MQIKYASIFVNYFNIELISDHHCKLPHFKTNNHIKISYHVFAKFDIVLLHLFIAIQLYH